MQKRREQMDYPSYQRNGWPIGSGTVESGHKQVMQARLKGAGMHWKPEHVTPMLALRMALCNDRWEENWADQRRLDRQQRLLHRRRRAQQRFHTRQEARRLALPPPPPKPLRQKTGRTEAQKRWGRRTFSPRLLQQAGGAKK
ncbi:MAG: hypothetical protein M3Z24_16715 [Chloroflexota bacterium]|nr:hypothetical protein [Chloroflexota bacterium]